MAESQSYDYSSVKLKLEAYCAYQDRCTFEVDQKLMNWGLSEKDRSALIDYLKQHRFLSDERFVESYVSGKVNIKRWGRAKIKMQLRQKRIPEDLILVGLSEIDDELYFSNLSALLRMKLNALDKEKDDFTKKVKVFRFLASKGYNSDEISEAYKSRHENGGC